jgi:glycogen(starch) synthase
VAKRLLMLSWEYPPRVIGGLARVVAALSKEIANDSDWEVHVVTADHPGTLEHSMDGKIHIHRVKTQTDTTPDFLTWVNKLNFGLLQYAIKLHLEEPFDVVHAHDWMVTDAAWVLKSGFGIPFVATMHATEAGRMHGIHSDMQHYIHQLEWRLTYEAWKVIVNSKSMLGELQNLFKLPADKIVVIPNGTDPDQFDFEFDPNSIRNNFAAPHEPIILYVGRIVNEKGVQVLLDAAPAILTEAPGARFLIVGTGYYLEDMRAKAQAMGIAQFVRFLGYVSDDDLKKLYKIASVVCIPSLYEPFGIVALEGMAAGVPVVTSDAGGLTDFVEHGVNGLTTYAGNVGSLAWGLLEVLRNTELAERIKQDAYEKVKNIYNWKAIAKKTLQIYDQVLIESEAEKKAIAAAIAAKKTVAMVKK